MLSLLLAVVVNAPFEQPTTIDDVRITGLWFSKQIAVERELTFQPGETVTPERWDLAEVRLWNLGVFSRVKLSLVQENEKNIAVVEVEDRFPLSPIVRANFGGGQFFMWLGLTYINFLGRAIELRGFYERFGNQNGFHLHILDPRFLNRRIAAQLEGEWLSRPQPEFVVRRAAIRAFIEFNAPTFDTDIFRLGLQVEGNLDDLFPVAGGPATVPPNSLGLFAGPYIRFGRLDTDRLRFKRGFVELHTDLLATTDPTYPFAFRATFEGRYFWTFGSRFNLGTRVLAGFERGAREQDRFYMGGLSEVRGYAYSEIRAMQYITANVEMRFVAFDSTWFAVMPIAFVDGGFARRDTNPTQPLASFGAGLRLMVPRLPRFGVRFEVAFPLVPTAVTPMFKPGINFGIWHYF